MMSKPFKVLSVLSLLTLSVFGLLLIFDVLNPFKNLKFLLVLFSLFFTFFSLGLFVHRQEVSKIQYFLFVILLILPVFTPLMGLISAEAISNYWKLFVGGMVFQMGTGIYALVGGFIKKGISPSLKILAVINYVLFLFLAFIMFFDITLLMEGIVFSSVGIIVSILSLLIVFLRKSTLSL